MKDWFDNLPKGAKIVIVFGAILLLVGIGSTVLG